MYKVSATIAIALAFAAAPSTTIAQQAGKVSSLKSPAALGVLFITERNTKVKVAALLPGGAGELMGILPGDVVTHAGETRINSIGKLTAFISKLKVGDPVEITVRRKGQSLKLQGTAMARQR